MNIFCDFHHQDLFFSLQLLFEERLGHSLFRPIGEQWYTEGYWHIADPYQEPLGTVKQYLDINSTPEDKTPPLNDLVSPRGGIYYFRDNHNNSTNKGITLDKFKEIKFDIIVATIPQHIDPYRELIRKYQPQAKFILQVGNIWWDRSLDFAKIPNLMSSTAEYPVPPTTNAVFYHQEFDTTIFKPQGKKAKKQIVSFINCLPQTGHAQVYYELKTMLPEYEFKSYGGSCDNGSVDTTQDIAAIMNESAFGFHAKKFGDGFGHALFNWYACGKPIITSISDYKGKLGEKLLEDGETCIDIDLHTTVDVCSIIRNITPVQYEYLCQQASLRFRECVNYDEEETKLRRFLENLR